MQDGSNRQSLRGSIGESIGRGFKRARNFISPPLTGYHRDENNPDTWQWYGPGQRPLRASSPTAAEEQEATARQQETLRIEEQKQGQIDNMIAQLNGVSGMALDNQNMLLRYVVASVIKTRGAGRETINLLRRSPIVLRILRDQVKNSRVANFACAAGSMSAACVKKAAGVLSRGASSAASSAKKGILKAIRPSQIPAAVVEQQFFPPNVSPEALRAFARQAQAAPGYASEASQQQQEYMDGLLQLQLSPYAPASAPASAPPSAPALDAEEDICAICFLGPGIDEYNVDHGPLGYVERHGNGAQGHPNRFHQSCLQGCQNKCPMCRAVGPVWGLNRPAGQGGGSRKTRSKSKSKTRRLRKSRNKSRKPRKSCKSRKPRSSSRRK